MLKASIKIWLIATVLCAITTWAFGTPHNQLYNDPVNTGLHELHAPGFNTGTSAQRVAYPTGSLLVSDQWFETDTLLTYQWNGFYWHRLVGAGPDNPTVTPTPSYTPTFSPTCNSASTPICGNQGTFTFTPTSTPTNTRTGTLTPTLTPTITNTITNTPSNTPTYPLEAAQISYLPSLTPGPLTATNAQDAIAQINISTISTLPTTITSSGYLNLFYPILNSSTVYIDGAGNTTSAALGSTGNLGDGIFNLVHLTNGSFDTGVGIESLVYDTTGNYNTGFGYQPLFTNTTGSNNTAVGYSALLYNTTASNNSAFGANSLLNNITGSDNSAFGYYSMVNILTGNDNTAIGYNCLSGVTIGGNNTALGFQALTSAVSINGCIGLGKDAGYYCTNSNEFYVGNQDWSTNANEKNFDLLSGTMAPTPTSDNLHTPGSLTVGNIGNATAITVYGNFVQCNASPTPTCVTITAP